VNLEEYRQRRTAISQALRVFVQPFAALLPARPTQQVFAQWVEAVYPAVYRARMEHYRLAEQFYREAREEALGRDEPVDFPRRNYGPDDLMRGLLARPTIPDPTTATGDDSDEDGEETLEDQQVLVSEVVDVAEQHALDGGREAMVDAARHDERALGYARVATGETTCAFCLMLVSRGPVYKDRNSALLRDGTSEPYHPRCDCEAVPVFERSTWPGRDQYLEMERAWAEHANGNLKDWRAWVEGRVRDEEDTAASA